jgi:RES domain-containing protein
MILWRVSNHRTLDGGGGLRASGRWHTKGRRVVYCAPDPAAALLEVLVHTEIDVGDLPVSLHYLEIEAPDTLAVEEVDPQRLARQWRTSLAVTRKFGDEWLRSGRTPLLRVPSLLTPLTWNTLINPENEDSPKVRIVRAHKMAIDRRLVL